MSYNHFTADVMRALGFTKLPVQGMEPVKVFDVRVWVTPLPPREPGSRHRRMNHRLQCECPRCAWKGSVGRIEQHACSRAETHCWGCGAKLDFMDAYRYGAHSYCDYRCVNRPDDEPRDYDEQDRRAAAEERIANHFNER